MKVLHINLNYYESSIYDQLSKSLLKQNCNVKVFYPTTITKNNNEGSPYLDQLPILNKYDRFFFKNRNEKINKYLDNNYQLNDYKILHAHSLFSNGYVAYTINKKYNIPYVVAVRDTDINHFFKKRLLLRKTGIKILEEASKIILLSKPYKEQLVGKYIPEKKRKLIESKIEIIPNGIDNFWHKNLNKNKNLNELQKQIDILSVGKITKRKNIPTSVEACKILMKSGYNVKLTVIGDVEDEQILRKIIKNKFVEYIPRISKQELIRYYRSSHIFLMPSLTETFGLVYAEAMSQGLPVLYSKGQGFDQQFNDGVVGYAVNKRSPKDIAKKILLILENYKEMTENCVQLVEKFHWDKIAKDYVDLYKNIIR